ncbi:hypothetical protein CW745_03555 [Psychromonas sp. psych-6C06]|uniref:hypothetical protein n=1 Tax=Psychromonas sp. psych-6C06 TaxID=2058089 RepID=UPI000C3480DA|nr:hypothetical protein [Psychromonas sp. psych-6C06]PKF62521.1 hypothetical protein CW745_03555 [Psychromonas sp. psych-6C06]
MAVSVNEVEVLKEHFLKVVERSEHLSTNVNEIIYPLLGFIILTMDEQSDIQVRSGDTETGNMLWFTTNGKRYAFRYEADEQSIVIRKGNFTGQLIAKVNNSTSTHDLKIIFNQL